MYSASTKMCHNGNSAVGDANISRTVIDHEMLFVGDALIPTDAGILDNYRVKRQLLHSW